MGKQPMDGGPTPGPVSDHSTAQHCFPQEAMGWTVSAKWRDHDARLDKGERRFEADLQDGRMKLLEAVKWLVSI